MTSPIAIPENRQEGALYVLQQGFQSQLRRPLASYALYAGHEQRIGDWGNEEIRWETIGDMSDVVLSMDIPPVQGDSMEGPTSRSVQVPIWTKDLVMGGRKWRQVQLSGMDPQLTRARAWAMAKEIDRFLLNGSAAGKPGPDYGLLNIPGMATTTGGNWTDPKVMNRNIGAAVGKVLDRGHTGSFDMLWNARDLDLLNEFIGDNPVRISENLPGTIGRILTSEHVSQGETFLINNNPDNYDVIAPQDAPDIGFTFGLGNVTVGFGPGDSPGSPGGSEQVYLDEIMKTRVVRFLNILTTRMNRIDDEAFVEKITFTRA